jgi:hypothetical protein
VDNYRKSEHLSTKPAYDNLVKVLEVVGLIGVGLFGFLRELKAHRDDIEDFEELFLGLKKNRE